MSDGYIVPVNTIFNLSPSHLLGNEQPTPLVTAFANYIVTYFLRWNRIEAINILQMVVIVLVEVRWLMKRKHLLFFFGGKCC